MTPGEWRRVEGTPQPWAAEAAQGEVTVPVGTGQRPRERRAVIQTMLPLLPPLWLLICGSGFLTMPRMNENEKVCAGRISAE